jgi:pimeloyl-ACP methyl ester carboxylesterase
MSAVWGHARNTPLSSSAVPGASLLDASRRLIDRSRPGLLATDLRACDAYRAPLEKLRAMAVPTLVVAGRRDQMTPAKAGKAVAAEIPGAKLVMLEAGHSMMTEAPRELLGTLREFLL